jgi:phosphoglycolate phosphatase
LFALLDYRILLYSGAEFRFGCRPRFPSPNMNHHTHPLADCRLLVFDLDGTLIDSKQDLVVSVNAMRAHFGHSDLSAEQVSEYVGDGAAMLVRRALGEAATDAEVEAALRFFFQHYRAHMLAHTLPYPGVRDTLELLAPRQMAVLTNKPVRISRDIIGALGLSRFFSCIYGGDSFERKKPDPMGLTTILGELSASPRQAMMIGDSDVDIQTARNAGTWACGVTYGFQAERLTACAPDLLLDRFEDLPQHLSTLAAPPATQ